MEEQIEIFVFPSPEVEEFLIANQIDLVELLVEHLQLQGQNVSKSFTKDPAAIAGQKASVKVIIASGLASASVLLAVTPIITNLIASLTYKNLEVHEIELVPVEDSNGNVVKDSSGEPMLQWVRRSRPLVSPEKMQTETKISVKGPFGFELTYSDSPQKSSQRTLPSSKPGRK